MPGILFEHGGGAGGIQHVAPACRRRRNTEPEKGKAGLEQDGIGDLQRREDDQDVDRVRQAVAEEQVRQTRPHAPCRHHEVTLAQFQQPRAHHARQQRPGKQRNDEDRRPDAGAGDRGEHQQEDDRRQRHDKIDKTHGDRIRKAAGKRRDRPDQETDDGGDDGRGERHQKRDPATVHHPGKDVAADAVGAEPVCGSRPRIHRQKIDVVGFEAPPQRIGKDCRDHQRDHAQAGKGRPVEQEAMQGACDRARTAGGASCQHHSAHLDARIDHRIGQIGHKVDGDDAGADHQRRTHDDRIVAAFHRIDHQQAHAGPVEDAFDEDRAADRKADGRADQRDDGQQRIAQGMLGDDPEFEDALGARRAHIVLVQHLEHGRARVAHDQRRLRHGQQGRWQDEVVEEVGDGKLPAGRQHAAGGHPAEIDRKQIEADQRA
ncbi:hypothetical protein RHECNPAF_2940041 [Rhizobium etli CNPAF512]|nr:hypothetical protein RHECNPAF_2940041 [Rhizobium etli CNPAF512]